MSADPVAGEEMPRMTERHVRALRGATQDAEDAGAGNAMMDRLDEIEQVIRELASPAGRYVLVPRTMTPEHIAAFERHAMGWLALSVEGALDQILLQDVLLLLRSLVSTPSTTEGKP